MADQSTVTVISTTTTTSTKVLTRTLLNHVGPFAQPTINPLNAAHIDASIHHIKLHSLYPYKPSLPFAIIFTVLFFLTTIHHSYLSIYLPTRSETLNKHRYTIPLLIASLLSTTGYLTQTISIQKHNVANLPLYTASTTLITISPIFICATLYLLLIRLITRCLPPTTVPTPTTTQRSEFPIPKPANPQRFFFLPPPLLSILLLTSTTLSLLLQCTGAYLASSTNWTHQPGTSTLLAGLILQLITFLLFLVVLHRFCLRVRGSATHGFNPCIMQVVTATWVSSGFVLLRMVFRLAEVAMGTDGYPFLHEWCLYVFEAVPVWGALAVLAWWHPVKWVQERVLAQAWEGRGRAEDANVNVNANMMMTMAREEGGRGVAVVRKPVAGTGVGDNDGGDGGSREGRGHVRRRSHVGFAL